MNLIHLFSKIMITDSVVKSHQCTCDIIIVINMLKQSIHYGHDIFHPSGSPHGQPPKHYNDNEGQ